MLINEVKSKVLPFKVHISEFSLSSLHLRWTPHSLLVAFVQRQLIFSPTDTVYREKPSCLHSPITRWIMCLYESEVIPSWFLTLLRGVIKTSDTLSAMGSDRLWLIRSLFPIDSLPASAVKPAHPKAETPGLPRPCGNQLKWGPGNFLTPTALLWSRKMKLLLCLLRMNQADGAATCNLKMCALPPRDSVMLLCWGPGCFLLPFTVYRRHSLWSGRGGGARGETLCDSEMVNMLSFSSPNVHQPSCYLQRFSHPRLWLGGGNGWGVWNRQQFQAAIVWDSAAPNSKIVQGNIQITMYQYVTDKGVAIGMFLP